MTQSSSDNLRLTGLTDRTFGVEIEFLFGSSHRSYSAVWSVLESAGLPMSGRPGDYTHRVTSGWKLVRDGSVGGGAELVSPILSGLEGLEAVRLACSALATAGAKISGTSCGLHVHHGGSDLDLAAVKTLARLAHRFKPIFDGLVPSSRREGASYCSGFTARELATLERSTVKTCGAGAYARETGSTCRSSRPGPRGSYTRVGQCAACSCARYRALNLRALHQHGTVEFRQHGGTVEASKIIPWILLTQGLVEKAKAGRSRKAQVKATGDGFKNLLRAAGLQNCKPHGHVVAPEHKALVKGVSKFLRERAKKFGRIALTDNSARRSRAGLTTPRVSRSAAERVAAALAAPAPAAPVSSSMADEIIDLLDSTPSPALAGSDA